MSLDAAAVCWLLFIRHKRLLGGLFGGCLFHIELGRDIQYFASQHMVGIFIDEHTRVGFYQCLYCLLDRHTLRTDTGRNFSQGFTLFD